MKNLKTILFILASCLNLNAASVNVYFVLTDDHGNLETNRTITTTCSSVPTASQSSVVIGVVGKYTTDANGMFTMSNSLVNALYLINVNPPSDLTQPQIPQRFKIYTSPTLIGTNANYNGWLLLVADSTSTFPAGLVAWSASSSDARYIASSNSVPNGYTPISTNGTYVWAPTVGNGTVTSVGLQLPPWLSISGSPVVASGTLAASVNAQTAAFDNIVTTNGIVDKGPTSNTIAVWVNHTLTNGPVGSDGQTIYFNASLPGGIGVTNFPAGGGTATNAAFATNSLSAGFATNAASATNASFATNAQTSTNFVGSLVGDVTGTQSATVVSQVGGVTSANVALGANAANAATSADTPSTIVKRDSSGNFGVGVITAQNVTTSNIFSTLVAAANFSGGTYSGDGSGLTNIPFNSIKNINTNVYALTNDARSVYLTNTANTFSGSHFGSFSGDGGGLTNLTASNLVNGPIPSGLLTGGTTNLAGHLLVTVTNVNGLTTNYVREISYNGGLLTNIQGGNVVGAVASASSVPAFGITGTVSTNNLPSGLAALAQSNGINLTNIPLSGLQSGGASSGNTLAWNGTAWAPSSAGSGTVTSVAMTGDGTVYNSTVSGSPITGTGTIAPSLKTQTSNTFLAGPTSGAASTPAFRALVNADFPASLAPTFSGANLTGIVATASNAWTLNGTTAASTNWIGTANNQAFNLRVNSKPAAQFTALLVPDHVDFFVYPYDSILNTSGNTNAAVGGGNSVAGGIQNAILNNIGQAFIGGGQQNAISASWSGVLGGANNIISSDHSFIGGGQFNTISNVFVSFGTISGGYGNTVGGNYGTIPGGLANTASQLSFAAGQNASATNNSTFVWSDGSNFGSTSNKQFLINATAGVGINTNNPGTNALYVNGWVKAVGFSGNGAGLTNVTASSASSASSVPASGISGVISTNNLPGNLAPLTQNNGSQLTSLNLNAQGLIPPGTLYDNGNSQFDIDSGENAGYGPIKVTVGMSYHVVFSGSPNDDALFFGTSYASGFVNQTGDFTAVTNQIWMGGNTPNAAVGVQIYQIFTNYETIIGDGSQLQNVTAAIVTSVTTNKLLLTNSGIAVNPDIYSLISLNNTPNAQGYTGPPLCINSWPDIGNAQGTQNGEGQPNVGFIGRCASLRNSFIYGLGFNTAVIDGGWLGYIDNNGFIHENANMWPDGISNCVRYAHSIGLKTGIWCSYSPTNSAQGWVSQVTNLGTVYWVGNTNYGQQFIIPGSGFTSDQLVIKQATQFANWGIDYIKMEGDGSAAHQRAVQLTKETFNSLGRKVYIMGAVGNNIQPWMKGMFGPRSGGHDMPNSTVSTNQIFFTAVSNFNYCTGFFPYAGPGAYADMDIIPDNIGATLQNSLVTMAAMVSASITFGAGSPLQPIYKPVIEVDQDPLGYQAFQIYTTNLVNGQFTIWQKPLFSNLGVTNFAVMFLNTSTNTAANYTVTNMSLFGMSSSAQMLATDLTSNIVSIVSNNWGTVTIPPQTAYGYKLSPVITTNMFP